MADRGTRSSGAVPSAEVVVGGTKRERAPPVGVRKTGCVEMRVGRRVGREEKVLGVCVLVV
jgi:hypothetical protein